MWSLLALPRMLFIVAILQVNYAVNVNLYNCSNGTSASGLFLGDGYFFFDYGTTADGWFDARSKCQLNISTVKTADFVSGDSAIVQKPDLAILWKVSNYKLALSMAKSNDRNYHVGLSQGNIDSSNCDSYLPSIFEPSFNWTWIDQTPLLWDTEGQGLVFFEQYEPVGGDTENVGGFYKSTVSFLNSQGCSVQNPPLCGIPGNWSYYGYCNSRFYV
jgi:hypothetical protein